MCARRHVCVLWYEHDVYKYAGIYACTVMCMVLYVLHLLYTDVRMSSIYVHVSVYMCIYLCVFRHGYGIYMYAGIYVYIHLRMASVCMCI